MSKEGHKSLMEQNRPFKYGILGRFFLEEKTFLAFIAAILIFIGFIYPYAGIARWVGFLLAAYSAISNDSIQTIGTFIASNEKKKWWILWLFIGGIFVATVTYSWIVYNGDVSYQRLASKGFENAPESFSYLQVAAPVFLLLLTRLRMPVSTTFLLLSSFATGAGAVGGVIGKSLLGYVVAFVTALIMWPLAIWLVSKFLTLRVKPRPFWRVFQWVSSGALWSVWVQQDAANIAVYLPRQLNALQFTVFTGFIFAGIGLLFYMRGDKIQQVVTEKTHMRDVRPASLIDFIYALILYFFKGLSHIPMSTTWVFIGLLGGRELALYLMLRHRTARHPLPVLIKMIGRDILFAGIGLLVSLIIAVAVNPDIQAYLLGIFE